MQSASQLAVAYLIVATSAQADQSIIRFTDRNITVVPGDNPGLPSYKMRFGSFAAGFTPTLANFSQWDANFNGSTGAHTPGVITTIDFTASDNSVHTLYSQMYMLVYNIAPNEATSTATSAALLTRINWINFEYGWFEIPGEDRRGNPIMREVVYNYQFGFGGWEYSEGSLRNWDEDNYLPMTSLGDAFSSPINDLVLVNGGLGVTSSFSAVPEPSSLGWVGLALAAAAMARRRRAAKAA
jgi:hypothetical protein